MKYRLLKSFSKKNFFSMFMYLVYPYAIVLCPIILEFSIDNLHQCLHIQQLSDM